MAEKVAVLFDFDGTLGDTETPAMEVAFWEIAAYLPDLPLDDSAALEAAKHEFMQDNAGRAFEFMVEDTNKAREAKGLPIVEEAWKVPPSEPLASLLDKARDRFGLKPLAQVLADKTYPDIFQMQKDETNIALSILTVPNPGVVDVCNKLKEANIPFNISTTSPKPRVPICVKAANLDEFFPPEKIHSGESDFNPPRFKPDPSVYLKAAESEGCKPEYCVAVEDSGSGVGSAANANVGVILGYVGGTHIPENKKDEHAKMLMSGKKSKNGRGAELVVEDFNNIFTLVEAFKSAREGNGHQEELTYPYAFPESLVKSLKGRVWLPAAN